MIQFLAIDPIEINNEDKEIKELRLIPINEKFCRIISMICINFSLTKSENKLILGTCLISFITILEYFNFSDEIFHFFWILIGGYFIG